MERIINSHNGELLGAYGNLVNRSLVFVQKSFDGKVPKGECNPHIKKSLVDLYPEVGSLIEQEILRMPLRKCFHLYVQRTSFLTKNSHGSPLSKT